MELTRTGTRPDRSLSRRLGLLALLGLAVTGAALLGTWSWGRLHPGLAGGADAVSADRAESIVRRTEVAFTDAEGVWGRRLDGYRPATLVFFTGETASPCAGGAPVSGPFYCPETGTAAYDLRLLDALGARLQRQRELGLALVTVRIAAEHLQRELGVLDAAALRMIGARRARRATLKAALALHADCLTGAWAAAAAPRLGPVPPDFYGQLVWSTRNVVGDLARQGTHVAPEFDAFATGPQDERQAAFARGYAASDAIGGCPVPAEIASGD